jgi:hypothetical protein
MLRVHELNMEIWQRIGLIWSRDHILLSCEFVTASTHRLWKPNLYRYDKMRHFCISELRLATLERLFYA